MLGGYDIFKEAKIRRFWAAQPQSRWRPLLLKKLYPYMPAMQSQSPAYLQAFFHVKPDQLASPFFSHLPRWGLTAQAKRFLSADVQAALNGYQPESELEASLPAEFSGWSEFAQAQYLEASGLLPGYILSSQGDRVQMANSVEGRCPFLDYRIAELAGRIPASMKMRGLDEKFVLKLATRDLVPPSVQARPKQPYRSMEVPSFFDVGSKRARFDYVDELLSPASLRQTGLFDVDAVGRLVDKARTGGVIGLKDSMALVSTLSAQLVAAQFVSRLGRLSE
jgi:asparagine synthase (glutamine-hydrolysing)